MSVDYLPDVRTKQFIFDICNQIIENLDNGSIYELSGGYTRDIDSMFDTIIDETIKVTQNNSGVIKTDSFQYLDKLSISVDETFRKACLSYFCLTVLPDIEINWHHVEWGNLIQLYQHLLVLASRNHGKSIWFSKVHGLWRLYRYEQPNPFNRGKIRKEYTFKDGLIITAEIGLGTRNLDWIRDEIEGNSILREKLYPKKSENNDWAKTSIRTKTGSSIQVKSFGSRLRGPHPHWILLDDFLIDNCLWSADIRQKYVTTFDDVIMPMLDKYGWLGIVGTPISNLDLYSHIRKNKKRFRIFEYPAVFPDGTVLWENRFDFDDLMQLRDESNSLTFAREYLVQPVMSESSIFPHELLMKCTDPNMRYVNNKSGLDKEIIGIVCGCDFAISAGAGADFSVFATIGVRSDNKFVILNIKRMKGARYDTQIKELKRLYRDFDYDTIISESNQMQIIFSQMMEDLNMPVQPSHTGVEKNDLKKGLPSLRTLFEQRRLIFPYGDEISRDITDRVINEFTNIAWTDKGLEGVGEHDDIVMSIWKAMEGAREFNTPIFGYI